MSLLDEFLLDEEWQRRAACLDKPSEWFFPERGKNTRKAAAVCAGCPVFKECDEYAKVNAHDGFWAGRMRG